MNIHSAGPQGIDPSWIPLNLPVCRELNRPTEKKALTYFPLNFKVLNLGGVIEDLEIPKASLTRPTEWNPDSQQGISLNEAEHWHRNEAISLALVISRMKQSHLRASIDWYNNVDCTADR